mgnify:CR=1 FL=1
MRILMKMSIISNVSDTTIDLSGISAKDASLIGLLTNGMLGLEYLIIPTIPKGIENNIQIQLASRLS